MKPYRPCNGDEGRWFENNWCVYCEADHEAHMGNYEDGCQILGHALAFDIGHELYPVEWRQGTGAERSALHKAPPGTWKDGPLCTAFVPDGCS